MVIALAGKIIFVSGLGRAEAFALAFDKHGQAAADLVAMGDQERAARASEAELFWGERNVHGDRLPGPGAYVK